MNKNICLIIKSIQYNIYILFLWLRGGMNDWGEIRNIGNKLVYIILFYFDIYKL